MDDSPKMQPASKLTLGQAAKVAGIAKGTLSADIKKGRLSATKEPSGNFYKIDPAELQRYVESRRPQPYVTVQIERSPTPASTPSTPPLTEYLAKIAALEVEVKLLRERQEADQEQIRDLRTQRDRAQHILEDQRTKATPIVQQLERRGLFGWFRKAG